MNEEILNRLANKIIIYYSNDFITFDKTFESDYLFEIFKEAYNTKNNDLEDKSNMNWNNFSPELFELIESLNSEIYNRIEEYNMDNDYDNPIKNMSIMWNEWEFVCTKLNVNKI